MDNVSTYTITIEYCNVLYDTIAQQFPSDIHVEYIVPLLTSLSTIANPLLVVFLSILQLGVDVCWGRVQVPS